ncbi:hypothetical protein ABTO54_19305, partial [Acinetobacter baumannii]
MSGVQQCALPLCGRSGGRGRGRSRYDDDDEDRSEARRGGQGGGRGCVDLGGRRINEKGGGG